MGHLIGTIRGLPLTLDISRVEFKKEIKCLQEPK